MPSNLFEQLAEVEVPPLPENFGKVVHQRVNRMLIAMHVIDFLVRGLPLAMLMFARGVIGLVMFTLTGEYLVERKREDRERPENEEA